MNNSITKRLLAVTTFIGALAVTSHVNANTLCGVPTISSGDELTINQTECTSGNGLYFYIDVDANNSTIDIESSGGTGEVDIFTNTTGWATRTENNASTDAAGTNDSLTVTVDAGRLYISLFGIHEQVNLTINGPESEAPEAPSICEHQAATGGELTLGQPVCSSGNGLYFYTDVAEDDTDLIITTTDGSGNADIYVSTTSWATSDNNDSNSANEGNDESLSIKVDAGKLYITLLGNHQDVTLTVEESTTSSIPTLPTNPGLCGEQTIEVSGDITFNQQECMFSNDQSIAYYAINVPIDDTEITIAMAGGTGDVNLYAKIGDYPFPDDFDYASENIGNSESIKITAPAGDLYLTLTGDYQQLSFLVSADTSAFEIEDEYPEYDDGGIPDDGFPIDATRFIGLNGQDLVERIAITHPQNVSPVYSVKGADATQLFSEANMLALIDAINSRVEGYTDEDITGMQSLIYFTRAAFYRQFYSPEDVPAYSSVVKTNITATLRALFANNNIWTVSETNGPVLREALVFVRTSGLAAEFNDTTIRVLNDYNELWHGAGSMNAVVTAVFTTVFTASYDTELAAFYAADPAILTVMNNFQKNHRNLLGTDDENVITNAVSELARLYHIDEIRAQVKVLVKGILDTTSKTDETKPLWLKAAAQANYYDLADCGYYNICGYSIEVEQETLSFNYQCSDSIKIRAQGLYNDQAAWICEVLGTQETNFHQILETLNIPVADDNNDDLELVVFDSKSDYSTYAGLFFNMSTNNGGMYLEGAPAADENQARFIAYEDIWERPNFHVWNLQHEFVHYLDGRYNLFGDFGDSISVNTIWWIEGLAEYISYRNGYSYAVSLGESQEFPLSEIFTNNYNSGQDRIYSWGYLAVRFMFENHRSDVTQILTYLRNNQYSEYQSFIDNIGTSYDSEWHTWLVSGLSTADNGIVLHGPSDEDATDSGTAGNWAGEPITISTDFSPCTPVDAANKHDPDNNRLALDSVVECVSSSSQDKATFIYGNSDDLDVTLELTISGGWGDADIMFSTEVWPKAENNQARTYSDGNNDVLHIQLDPNKTWHMFSLVGKFGGVKLEVKVVD
ncbi:MAG: collagenase [Colwellia sp.]|nr:collagenase [Colwellia sp.]